MLQSPFTKEQVESLNGYQEEGYFHPFTCGKDDCRQTLVATEDGWVCPDCDYKQNWAHEFMADNTWKKESEHLKQIFENAKNDKTD